VFYFGGFFSQTGIFAGFSLHIINLAVRISAAMMAGDIIFLGCRTVYKGAMDGARGGEYYISKPLWSSGKIYASGSPSSGLKKKEPFCFWKFRGVSLYILSEGSAKLRWVGRVAHLGGGVAQ
jgi:hypothetical protein